VLHGGMASVGSSRGSLPHPLGSEVLPKPVCDDFPIGSGRTHAVEKSLDLRRESPMSLSGQHVADLPPAPLYLFAGLDQGVLPWLGTGTSSEEVPASGLRPSPHPAGFPSLVGSVDPVELG
jgi:hypothetical protein